jgi:large subunit ribosomal protein L4
MPQVPVLNLKGEEVERINLDDRVFNGEVNSGIIYQAVLAYQANKRLGCASTKTQGEVSGGGRKPWKQKGTGRARVGSIRSPLWRGGGVVFGPKPRDYRQSLPAGIKRKAMVCALNSKLNENNLVIVDQIAVDEAKTRNFKKILDTLNVNTRCLVVLDKKDESVLRASRNIAGARVTVAGEVSAYDILYSNKVILTKGAISKLLETLRDGEASP